MRAIPRADWDEEAALELAQQVDAHDPALRLPLLSVGARFSGSIHTALVSEMRGGSLDALAALGGVAELSDEDVEPLIERLAHGVRSTIVSAHNGSFGFPQYDLGAALTLLNAWHHEVAQWEPLLELLHDERVHAEQKAQALVTSISLESKLAPEIRPQLREAAVVIASSAGGDDFPVLSRTDARGAATALAELLDDDPDGLSTERFVDLLSGESDRRLWAAKLASRLRTPEDVGFLTALAQDTEPEVRAAAAAGLATAVAEGTDDSVAANALQRASTDPGVMVPRSIALVLSTISRDLPAVAADMLKGLRDHISASVRLIAANADEGLLA